MRVARLAAIDPAGWRTATYWLELTDPSARAGYSFEAGQINMLYLWGLGEVPISVASDPATPELLGHTVRVAGSVTSGFPRLSVGDEVGLRGPFGRPWPMEAARGGDLLVVAGGLGLAPLRSALLVALRERHAFGRVVVVAGARTPDDVIYRRDLEAWKAEGHAEVRLTVDRADADWPHDEGLVTVALDDTGVDPGRTTAFVCGPEVMMTAVADDLVARGLGADRLFLTLERNMQCAVRRCGHCQLGPAFVCADGPVFAYDEVGPWLRVAHL